MKRLLALLVVVAILIAVGLFWRRTRTATKPSATPTSAAEIVSHLKTMADLPDEAPTLAVVSDLAALPHESFFARAASGDRLLIFSNSKQALLWRPSSDKIIQFAPVTVQAPK